MPTNYSSPSRDFLSFSVLGSVCLLCLFAVFFIFQALFQKIPPLADRSIVPARTSPASAPRDSGSSPPPESTSALHRLSASGSTQTLPSFSRRYQDHCQLRR